MNKFVLIPKDQYEKFMENQERKDNRAPNKNHIPEKNPRIIYQMNILMIILLDS